MPRTVLIADESITIRSVAESLLRGESFSVHSAADGNMALEVAHAEHPDLALIGEKLAGLGGPEVCKAIKSDPELKSIPIIFMRADRPGPAPEHADAVLTKPFSPQSLLDSVHRFLASDEAREGTSPVSIAGSADPGLEEELIDQALGLDDVGPAPGEELDIAAGRSPVGLDLPGREDALEPRPFSLVDDGSPGGRPEDIEDVRMSKALDESFGITDEPALEPGVRAEMSDNDELQFEAVNTREPEDEVDLAIDAAFGESSAAGKAGGARTAPAQGDGKHSLQEVNLGEADPPPAAAASDRQAVSSAAPGGGIDLGGVDEAEDDRPHDYDWFIKEMQQEPRTGAPKAQHEPPRIEPLAPLPSAAHHPLSERPAAPGATGKSTDPKSDRPKPQRPYDDFISEFRAEIARIEGMAAPPDALAPEETDHTKHSQSGKIVFEEVGERSATPPPSAPATIDASIRAWGDELIDSVTAQVARELAAKIDSKVIYSLIEQKLKESQRNRT